MENDIDLTPMIGIPYAEKDCWNLVVEFYSRYMGQTLKHYYSVVPKEREDANGLIYSNMGEFERVETPRFGDILLIKLYGVECHIGVFLGGGKILHTTKHSGSLIDTFSRWEKLIVGVYRVKNP